MGNVEFTRKKVKCLLGALLVLLCLGAGQAAAQEVTYRLKWLANMSTVGDVYARDHGYFSRENLEVDIKPGGPEHDAVRELELGYADFGVASADQVIRAVDKGAPLVVLAQLFYVNPLQWMYRSARFTIMKPRDLLGKTIGVTFGKNDEIIMRTLLAEAGIKDSQVRLFSVRLDYTPFYRGEVDLWPVYINTQGVEIGQRLQRAGEKVAFLKPDRFGVRFVANSVITSQRIWTEQPGLAKRFTRALLAGWQAALDPANAHRAMETVANYDRDASPAVLAAQLDATRRLVVPRAGLRMGAIDRKAWLQTEKIMLDYHQIRQPVDIGRYLKPLPEG